MLIKVFTEKTVKETAAAPEVAVEANHIDVWQPKQAKKVLKENMRFSTAL